MNNQVTIVRPPGGGERETERDNTRVNGCGFENRTRQSTSMVRAPVKAEKTFCETLVVRKIITCHVNTFVPPQEGENHDGGSE
jgi:hypothetical protein